MPLERLFSPRSIAVIGASRDSRKVGYTIVKNIRSSGYRGAVFPINPFAKKIVGYTAYPSVLRIPISVDVAVIAVAAPAVPSVLIECGKKNISFAVIISSGFKEVGPSGAALERKIRSVAARAGIRILGPNCLGFLNGHVPLNASFTLDSPIPGGVSLISQSGAIIGAFIDWSLPRKVGSRILVSTGNAQDIQEVDVLTYLAADKRTSVIGIYLEEIHNLHTMMQIASRITAHKPIVVLKVGKSAAAAQAALSHTGSLVSSDAAMRAAFRQCGIIVVEDLEVFFNTLQMLSHPQTQWSSDVIILSNAGGPAIIAIDTVASTALTLTRLNAQSRRTLQAHLPTAAAVTNPIDILGDADLVRFKQAAAALDATHARSSVCVLVTPQSMTPLVELANFLVAWHRKRAVGIVVSFIGGGKCERARSILMRGGVPAFNFPNDALAALEKATSWQRIQRAIFTPAEPKAHQRPHRGHLLSYKNTEKKLRDARISFVSGIVCRRVGDLSRIPSYPIALKALAPELTHKKKSGALLLPIHNYSEAKSGFVYLSKKFHSVALEGILAQPLQKPGVEMFIGLKRDPAAGMVITVGLGGSLIELQQDFSMKILPIQRPDTEDMLNSLEHQSVLTKIDRSYILNLLLKMSTLAVSDNSITELDLNPIIVYKKGGEIVDARIVT